MKLLCSYLIDDGVCNIYLLITVLLPCLIYQGVMKIKAKNNMKKMPAKYYVGVYAFLVYLWAVFKVTGIGLLADIIRPGIRGGVNLRPFADLGIGFWLNIVMFLPLGIVTPCIWKKCESVRYTVRLGFAVSLLIKCSQIFNGRATDIDDLIANTSGACLGYVIWFKPGKLQERIVGRNVKWLVTIQLQWLKENGSRLSMWRWHFLEHFSCTIHMQYKDTRGGKRSCFSVL